MVGRNELQQVQIQVEILLEQVTFLNAVDDNLSLGELDALTAIKLVTHKKMSRTVSKQAESTMLFLRSKYTLSPALQSNIRFIGRAPFIARAVGEWDKRREDKKYVIALEQR